MGAESLKSGKNVALAVFLVAAMLLACAGPEDSGGKVEQRKPSVETSELDSFQLNGVQIPGKIYITCFYGKNDTGGVAEAKCKEMFKTCKDRYGDGKCQVLHNPDVSDLEKKIGNKGLMIVVGHSTPNGSSPDKPVNPKCKYDIWDTPVTPIDISNCGLPIIWYGCYGSGVAKECRRVIPLQDKPQILDSRDPEISCRFKATMYCYEWYSQRGEATNAQKISQCVPGMMQRMKDAKDPYCK